MFFGGRAELLQPVEIPQVQFLVYGVMPVVAEGRGDSTGAVPGRGCLHARCVQTVLGYDSAENCGTSAVAVLSWWSMSLFMQFIDGCGCPCVFAETVGLLLEVLRLSSSPELVDFPVSETGFLRGLMAMRG